MVRRKPYKGSERRKYLRFGYPLFINYKKNGEGFKAELLKPSAPFYFTEKGRKAAVSHDISIGGISFVTREKLERGAKLTVEIWSPIRHDALIGLVEVIWQKRRYLAPGYLTGVAFISLDDRKELKRLLEMLTNLKLEEVIEK